jgi:hypothetical protein
MRGLLKKIAKVAYRNPFVQRICIQGSSVNS